jgi:hypothetical protein
MSMVDMNTVRNKLTARMAQKALSRVVQKDCGNSLDEVES